MRWEDLKWNSGNLAAWDCSVYVSTADLLSQLIETLAAEVSLKIDKMSMETFVGQMAPKSVNTLCLVVLLTALPTVNAYP